MLLATLVVRDSRLPHIASEDGGELYVFDATGRHLRTVDALTTNVLYQFGHNAAGLLVTVTDLGNQVSLGNARVLK